MTVMTWTPGPGWAMANAKVVIWLPAVADPSLLTRLHSADSVTSAQSMLASAGQATYVLVPLLGPPRATCLGAAPMAAVSATGAPLVGPDFTGAQTIWIGAPSQAVGLPLVDAVVACGGVRLQLSVDNLAAPTEAPKQNTRATVVAAPVEPNRLASAPATTTEVLEVPDSVAAAGDGASRVEVRDDTDSGEPNVTAPSDSPASAGSPSGGVITSLPWIDADESEPNPFAALWGNTTHRPVEEAAVREVRNSDAEIAPDAAVPETVPAASTESAAVAPESPDAAPAAAPAIDRARSTTLFSALDEEQAAVEIDYGWARWGDTTVTLHDVVVIGRAPQALPGQECSFLRVESPQRGISRSHVAVRCWRGEVQAKDLGSNNGTVLVTDRESTSLSPEAWTTLSDGCRLDLGEGVVVTLGGLP